MAAAGSPTERTTVENSTISVGTPAVEGPTPTKEDEAVDYDATNSKQFSFDQAVKEQVDEWSEAIVYKEEYIRESGRVIHVENVDPRTGGRNRFRYESRVLEVVDVYYTPSTERPLDGVIPISVKGQSYIRVVSPSVISALRHVVNYYPSQDLGGDTVIIYEPYTVVVHHEEELKEYRQKFAPDNPAAATAQDSCANRLTYNHVGVLLDYVDSKIGAAVRAERERNVQGCTSPDMEWLAFRPGTDVYYKAFDESEWNPYVVKAYRPRIQNGHVKDYYIQLWNLDVDSDRPEYLGLHTMNVSKSPGVGDGSPFGRMIFPCSFFPEDETLDGKGYEELRTSFVDRGRMFVRLLKGGCYQFEGTSITKPIKRYNGLVMVDAHQWISDRHAYEWARKVDLDEDPGPPAARTPLCDCARCLTVVGDEPPELIFDDYDRIHHSIDEDLITDHQYFLCSRFMEAFLFKTREWVLLNVSGFKDPIFDRKMIHDLVLAQDTKEMIIDLTKLFVKEKGTKEDHIGQTGTIRSESELDMSAWSADFVKGKGEGLIFLLHGKPGVGKTYTAECVAALTERPLLSLTCADIGTDPEKVEASLRRWFSIAQNWGAIMLIDEADVYMEQRKVQDLVRNNLVAGFLRALEYYQGILFLTTNRVGTFDEAFISRIHITIHYSAFTDKSRAEVWESFFRKLQSEREGKVKILEDTRDYVTEKEVRELEWNGREIRNAFQIAVALAQVENDCDDKGRIQIKRKHIKSTVRMSKNFKSYLKELYQKDETQRAAAWGHRYDAFGKSSANEGNFM